MSALGISQHGFEEGASPEDMPPQPLSNVRRNARYRTSPYVLHERQDMAALVGQAVGYWALTENALAQALVHMLGAEARPAVLMFLTLQAANARDSAMRAAAEAKLSAADLELFHAVSAIAGRAGKERHKLAHHIWGKCEELPDALVLIEPEAHVESTLEHEELNKDMPESAVGKPPPQRKWGPTKNESAFVYRVPDLEGIVAALRRAHELAARFALLISPSGRKDDRMRYQLSNEPDIREEVAQIRKRRESVQSRKRSRRTPPAR